MHAQPTDFEADVESTASYTKGNILVYNLYEIFRKYFIVVFSKTLSNFLTTGNNVVLMLHSLRRSEVNQIFITNSVK